MAILVATPVGATPLGPPAAFLLAPDPRCAEPCAHTEQLASALRLRFPQVAVAARRAPQPGDWLVSLSRVEAGWELVVQRHDGAILLARELAPDCAEPAPVCVLIIDRLLGELTWARTEEGELPPPKAPIEAAPSLAVAPSAAVDPASGSPVPLHLAVGAAAAWTPGAATWSGGPRAAAVIEARPWLRLGVEGNLLLSGDLPVSHAGRRLGTLRLVPLTLLAGAGWCPALDADMSACLELLAGAVVTWASVQGRDLYDESATAVTQAAAGGGASLCRLLHARLAACAVVRVLARPGGARLTVEGLDAAAYRTPGWQALAGLDLAGQIL